MNGHFFLSIFRADTITKRLAKITALAFLSCAQLALLGAFIYAKHETDTPTKLYTDEEILDNYYLNDALLPLAAVVIIQPIFGLVHWSMYKAKKQALSLLLITILGVIGIIATPFMVIDFCS